MDNPNIPVAGSAGGAPSIVSRLRDGFEQFSGFTNQPGLRRALPAILIVSIAAIGLAAFLLLSPAERVSLQTGLPEAEKARALEVLTAQGFNAQLDPATGALTVTSAEYYRARMALATEGLPQGTPDGMASISDMPMGTSRSVESARLRRMQELDLARTIAELQPVRAARVHLALPERSAFVRDVQPPRASIVVQLAPGLSLSEAQVRAVVSLVSAAVPSMPRENVSVVDQTGRLLSNEADDPFQEQTNSQMRHQLQVEQLYRERIMALVMPMVGAGNVAVEVTLDMDFTRSEVTNEEYNPNTTALRSEQQSIQQSGGAAAMGIPGAVSNTPPPDPGMTVDEPGAAEATASTNSSTSVTRNYEVSRRVETTLPQTATISRVNAAVLLRAQDTSSEEAIAANQALIDSIEALTRSAIGYQQERGDVITVSSSPFVAVEEIPAPAWHEAGWLPDMGRALAQLAILALILIGVVRPLLTRLLPAAGSSSMLTTSFSDAVEVGKGETLQTLRKRLESTAPDADELNGAITYEEKVALLQRLASDETDRIASAFHSMLTPEQTEEDT